MIINILISIFIILISHFLWNYLKDNLTTKKTKDLANIQANKYKKIVEEIQKTTSSCSPTKPFENEMERKEMENDLSLFLQNMENVDGGYAAAIE
jgi:hypothetical protein